MSAARDETMPGGTTGATPGILLAHHLKQLKLPTVLREYDKVARECAQGGVDHPRYLLRLVELELIDRERRMVERRIRSARFPAVAWATSIWNCMPARSAVPARSICGRRRLPTRATTTAKRAGSAMRYGRTPRGLRDR